MDAVHIFICTNINIEAHNWVWGRPNEFSECFCDPYMATHKKANIE
jgi:hypothetical protein